VSYKTAEEAGIDRPLHEIIRGPRYPWQATRTTVLQHNQLCGKHVCTPVMRYQLTAFPTKVTSDK